MKYAKLIKLKKWVKLRSVAEEAGINPATVSTKMHRKQDLTPREGDAMKAALRRLYRQK